MRVSRSSGGGKLPSSMSRRISGPKMPLRTPSPSSRSVLRRRRWPAGRPFFAGGRLIPRGPGDRRKQHRFALPEGKPEMWPRPGVLLRSARLRLRWTPMGRGPRRRRVRRSSRSTWAAARESPVCSIRLLMRRYRGERLLARTGRSRSSLSPSPTAADLGLGLRFGGLKGRSGPHHLTHGVGLARRCLRPSRSRRLQPR